jgi:hypothetical protein
MRWLKGSLRNETYTSIQRLADLPISNSLFKIISRFQHTGNAYNHFAIYTGYGRLPSRVNSLGHTPIDPNWTGTF